MSHRTNPKISQRAIAAALRGYRAAAGVTLDEAARSADYDPASLSRAEQAKGTPHPAVVRALLRFYGETDEQMLDKYAAIAKHGRKRGWWAKYSDLMTVAYVGLEGAATQIRWVEPQLVPGLLQTDDYTRALITAENETAVDEEIRRRMEVRASRRQILTAEQNPTEVSVVIDESVLCRPIGGSAVMAAQLDHLLAMGRRSNIEIQVLPFAAGEHGSLGGRFVVLKFEDAVDPGTVFLEQVHWKDGFVEEPDAVRRFDDAFGRLRSVAESPKRSASLIRKARDAFVSS